MTKKNEVKETKVAKVTKPKATDEQEVKVLLGRLDSLYQDKQKAEPKKKQELAMVAKKLRRQLRSRGYYISKQKGFQYGRSIVHELVSK